MAWPYRLGTSAVAQLEGTLAAARLQLSADEFAALSAADQARPHIGEDLSRLSAAQVCALPAAGPRRGVAGR